MKPAHWRVLACAGGWGCTVQGARQLVTLAHNWQQLPHAATCTGSLGVQQLSAVLDAQHVLEVAGPHLLRACACTVCVTHTLFALCR